MGIIVNCLSVLFGGLFGGLATRVIPDKIKEKLPTVLGITAISMGIYKLIELDSITVVMLSLNFGYIIGSLIGIENLINRLATLITVPFKLDEDKSKTLILAILIFCFSGTGIFGVVNETLAGDSSVLLVKSILDFFTAATFASVIGFSVSLVSIFQLAVMILLRYVSMLIAPIMTPYVLNNFVALGGMITMTIGFKLSDMVDIETANVLPAFILVIVLSQFM